MPNGMPFFSIFSRAASVVDCSLHSLRNSATVSSAAAADKASGCSGATAM